MALISNKLNNLGGFCYNIYIIVKCNFNFRNVTDLQHILRILEVNASRPL